MDINKVISAREYDFLREHPRLGDNIALLTFGGSIAYGLDTPESDIDVRGIIMPDPDDLLAQGLAKGDAGDEHLIFGNYGFEQYIDTSSKRLRQAHQHYWMNRQQQLRETMNKSNVDMISIATNDDFVKHLLMLFKQRS